jgi:hypothetical protein
MQRTNRLSRNLTIALLVITAMAVGCAKNVTPHPNQINSFDGQTYDALVSAQGALDEAKAQYASGKLPSGAKTVINDAGATYESARTTWATWRDITLGVKVGDADAVHAQLVADMAQLAVAITNVVKLTSGGK